MKRELGIGLVVLALGLIAPLQAGVVTGNANVSGTAIIWGAGNIDAKPDLQASLPPSIAFDLTATSISFSNFSGTVKYAGGATPNDAEGQAGGTDISGYGGISGIQFNGRQFFLVGVFLGPGAATGTAPATLDYSTTSNASVFNPLLAQVFFIGDGQGSAGQQTFNIPTGATRLFWGFGDGVAPAGSSIATPGTYGDNSGSVSFSYAYDVGGVAGSALNAPEPSSIVLMGLGIAALTLLRRRRAS